jgi:hypothetical protein
LEENKIRDGNYCALDHGCCIPLNNKHTITECGFGYDLYSNILIVPIPQPPFSSVYVRFDFDGYPDSHLFSIPLIYTDAEEALESIGEFRNVKKSILVLF